MNLTMNSADRETCKIVKLFSQTYIQTTFVFTLKHGEKVKSSDRTHAKNDKEPQKHPNIKEIELRFCLLTRHDFELLQMSFWLTG